jgi:lipopolysaccharide transport system permease protein
MSNLVVLNTAEERMKGESAQGLRPPTSPLPESEVLTIIEPRRGWRTIDFRELWRYRELLYTLVWRDVKVRYKQTVLGAIWAMLPPVFTMVIFSLVLGKFAGLSFDAGPYPIVLFAGLLPWTLFSNAVSSAGESVINQSHLLTKIYFPRLLVPTASIGSALVDFALGFLVYAGLMVYFRHLPGASVVLLPVLILLTVMMALGTGYILSALTVSYRDFRHVIPFMLQAWFFLSPVAYDVKLVPEHYRWIVPLINPMTGIIKGFRHALLNDPMTWWWLAVSALFAMCVFVLGAYNFRRVERRFADIA